MNKKISTLMMGGMLLAVPSLVSAQGSLNDNPLKKVDFTTATDKSNSHDNVLIIRDVDNSTTITDGDLIFYAQLNEKTGKITYKSVKITNGKATLANEKDALWSIQEEKGGIPGGETAWFYSLKSNSTGCFLTVDYSSAFTIIDTNEKSLGNAGLDETKKVSTYFQTQFNSYAKRIGELGDNEGLYLYYGDNEKAGANALLIDGGSNGEATIGVDEKYNNKEQFNIILAEYDARTVDVVDELNDVKGGKGFEFSFPNREEGSVLNNIFEGLELRAFNVKNDIKWTASGNPYIIPAGIYLATDWSGLDEDILAKNEFTKDDIAEFQKATFLAVSPQDFTELTNTKDKRKDGVGFELTTVQGSAMNFYDAATAKTGASYDYNANLESKAAEVYVGNACFDITVPSPLSANDQYKLSVDAARLDTKGNNAHEAKAVVIGVMPNTNNVDDETESLVYLVTRDGGLNNAEVVKAVPSTTIADVTALLNKEATPAIYAVKFLSGEDVEEGEASEYGQYLTIVNNSNAFKPAIMPSVNDGANENDPLYQFVVTAVADENGDDEYETVTLTNRQTKQPVTVVLYAEEELGKNVYTIYPKIGTSATSAKWLIAKTDANEDLAWESNKSYKGMVVELIKKENVDKFATFETAKSEEGLYTFEFAKTAESGDRLYGAAKRDDAGEIDYSTNPRIVTAETADQFELIRVKDADKKDKVSYILNDFIYMSNDRVMASQIEKDTVAFYSYNVRFFAPDQDPEYYLNAGNLKTTASEYVIKYNLDGSVSMFDSNATAKFVTGTTTLSANKDADYLVVSNELQDAEVNAAENIDESAWTWGDYYKADEVANIAVKTFMVPETVYGTLNPVPQTTAFEDVNGFGYVNMNENKQAILLPTESMTFRLDTVDTDSNIPSFYISKDNNFLYFAKDSADSYRLTDWTKYEFQAGDGRATRLMFKAGELVNDSQALQTMVDGKSVVVEEKADRVSGALGGLNYFKFQVLESGDGDDTYVIRNKEMRQYVININGTLTLKSDLAGATRFVVNPKEATANEDVISASSVNVIAGNGQITIAGAAGKKVVVSNILGQVVANTVITSDNATIAAPQGIVVVAVEGEEAVKAIVK